MRRFLFYILILALLIWPDTSHSQRWKKYRYEFSYGLGGSNFMGDVGVPETKLINEYFYVNPYFIRPIGNAGIGYRLQERLNTKANLHFGFISADDRYGNYRSRNLKFTSLVVETSAQIEYYIVKDKRKRNIYRTTRRFKRKLQNISLPTYLFVGFGGSFFSTNLKYIGSNPSISGESYLGRHSVFTGSIPLGIGIRYKISNRIYLGLEASHRYTLSDKVDSYSPESSNWIDSYQYLIFTMNYKLKSARTGLPRFRMTY